MQRGREMAEARGAYRNSKNTSQGKRKEVYSRDETKQPEWQDLESVPTGKDQEGLIWHSTKPSGAVAESKNHSEYHARHGARDSNAQETLNRDIIAVRRKLDLKRGSSARLNVY